MNVVYEAPISMAPFVPPVNDHLFLPHMSSWRDLIKERLNESIERYVFQFSYLEDYQINDDLITRVLGKMNLSSQERHELFTQHQERHSLTSSGHDRTLLSSTVFQSTLPSSSSSHTIGTSGSHLGLFTPLRITLRIEFFSLLDYLEYNQGWIQSNWTVYHVTAFLRLTNQRELEDLFIESQIDGRALFQLVQPVDHIPFPRLKELVKKIIVSEEIGRSFRGRVLRLGSVDHLEVLQEVMQEECRVRGEYERKEEMMMATAKAHYRQQAQQQQSQRKPPATPTAPSHAPTASALTTPSPQTASSVSTPATTVYKFSHLASHSSSSPSAKQINPTTSGTASPSPSPQTPTIHYGNEEKEEGEKKRNHVSSPIQSRGGEGEGEEVNKENRLTRGETLFSDGLFEVVMVGEGAVGKTSILNRICQDQFHAIEKPTIGTRLVQHALGKLVLDIWDTGGQPAQHATMKARAKRADVILAIYDVSNRDSLIALKNILEDLFQLGLCLS
jgi:hypothetical protein